MGLPLFVTPVEPEEAAKIIDKNAARSRSSIRRQRTARRPNYPVLQMADFFDAESPTEDAERDTSRARGTAGRRLREAVPLPRGSLLAWSSAPPAHRDNRHSPLSPYGQNADGLPPPPMPPVPESRDFYGDRGPALNARRGRSGRPWPDRQRDQHLMELYPTIIRRETSNNLTNAGSGAQVPALTPNFSPVRRYALEESADRPGSNSPPSLSTYPDPSVDAEWNSPLDLIGASRDRFLRDLPPLRRMGRRSISDFAGRRRLRAARLDGLGDRDRSLSPDGDGAWETMLTTLTPDPQLPSAGSSFASGPGTTSNSSNAETSATSLTTMDSTSNPNEAMDAAIDNACDLIEDSQQSSDMSDTEGEDEEDIYELDDTLGSRDRFWHAYSDIPLAERAARHRGEVEMDSLAGWQRVVSRLARRGDIPDEWWAQVGFIRSIPREAIRL